jgi:hypothetical protein
MFLTPLIIFFLRRLNLLFKIYDDDRTNLFHVSNFALENLDGAVDRVCTDRLGGKCNVINFIRTVHLRMRIFG